MTDAPNSAEFSRNDRDGEYTVYVRVSGQTRLNIKAADEHDARRQAEAEVDKLERDGYVEIDKIDLMEVWRIHKDPPMYRVMREGKPMQVSHLQPGDTPREPDAKYGF